MTWVARRSAVHVFRVHVPLDTGEMPNQLAGCQPARPGLPFQIFLSHRVNDPTCSLMHAIEVLDERPNSGDFHDLRVKREPAIPITILGTSPASVRRRIHDAGTVFAFCRRPKEDGIDLEHMAFGEQRRQEQSARTVPAMLREDKQIRDIPVKLALELRDLEACR